MQVYQMRCDRTSDERIQGMLRDFVDVLLDTETELRDANQDKWDRVLTHACRERAALAGTVR